MTELEIFRAIEAARAAHRRGTELITAARAAAALHNLDPLTVVEHVNRAEGECRRARKLLSNVIQPREKEYASR